MRLWIMPAIIVIVLYTNVAQAVTPNNCSCTQAEINNCPPSIQTYCTELKSNIQQRSKELSQPFDKLKKEYKPKFQTSLRPRYFRTQNEPQTASTTDYVQQNQNAQTQSNAYRQQYPKQTNTSQQNQDNQSNLNLEPLF